MAVQTPPNYVKQILMTLEGAGYGAFLVGGCVRDMLMGRRPHDWDVCTSALPEDVLGLFPGALPTGLKHGTVTVRCAGRHVEVTTFRTDGTYSDHRRPDNVRFIPDLYGDLRRRDFTMNAIAVPLSGVIEDPFGGQSDITAGVIRCVGDPATRFEEDALRMFRALRFSAQLGFCIASETLVAIRQKAELAAALAPERIRDELEKTLCSPSPAALGQILELHLLDAYVAHPLNPMQTPASLSHIPKNRALRWAGFCALLHTAGLVTDVEAFTRALRLDTCTIRSSAAAAEIAAAGFPAEQLDIKRLLADRGVDVTLCTAAAADVLGPAGHLRAVRAVLRSGDCFSLKRLAITGDDLLDLGFRGRALGDMLHRLLDHVLEHPQDNERNALLQLAVIWR
jgi:tRNA nucleotidyltransferase (CCA-adding enzyme)